MRLILISLIATLVVACGGGEMEPPATVAMQAAVPAAQPKVLSVPITNAWPDVYPKFRLNFDSSTVTGFADLGEAVKPEDLEVVWHSGGTTAPASSPNAPRGAIQRGADGKLFAELPLFYSADRGVYVLAKKGFGPYPDVNGQPGGYMLVDEWQLPAGMQVVEIPGPNGPRRWIDWKLPQ